ncbi:MAG TPA: hypothetical protein VGA69_03875 [Nitriliruptorales bacterium]
MLLCDYAQVADGKLNMLGAGWSVTTGNAPFGIAILVLVPWDQANMRHAFRLELIDGDGNAVHGPDGQPIALFGDLEVGRPPNTPHGIPLESMLALNFAPIALPPGQRWEWRLSVNEAPAAVCAFSTRPAR